MFDGARLCVAAPQRPFVALGLALLTVPAAALVGHPVVSYAKSASMTPTIGVGDGFFVDPFVREPDVGDIIVFVSETRGGALAVHRVIERTADGYVTKGDANELPDQANGEPAIVPAMIRGRVVEADGAPILVHGLGEPLLAIHAKLVTVERAIGSPVRAAALLLGLAGIVLVLPRPAVRPRPRRSRGALARRLLPRGILVRHAALAACVLLAAVGGALVAHAKTEASMSLVVTADPPAGQVRSTIPGGSVPREFELAGFRLLPTALVLEPGARVGLAENDRILDLAPGEARRVAVSERAEVAGGLQEDALTVWRYPRVLPDAWTLALHRAIPGAPAALPLAALTLVAGGAYVALRAGDMPLAHLVRGGRAA